MKDKRQSAAWAEALRFHPSAFFPFSMAGLSRIESDQVGRADGLEMRGIHAIGSATWIRDPFLFSH
jgi:hypothetical protein